jgi:hypothetical protein
MSYTPKELVDSNICTSLSEAKRMIYCIPESKIQETLDNYYGRKPAKSKRVYPKIEQPNE